LEERLQATENKGTRVQKESKEKKRLQVAEKTE
jgi:hypothetical protein